MYDKLLIKDIYEFAKSRNLESFHSVGYGILPSITLLQIQENRNIEPCHYITVNSKFKSYSLDKKVLQDRFKIPVMTEYDDPELYVRL